MLALRLAKAASLVAFLTVASKLLGFVREAAIAGVFGATSSTDAYLVAQTIPALLFSTVSYAVTTTFIPIYSHIREERGRQAGFEFANSVLWALSLIAIVLVICGEFLAKPLARLVAPGFGEHAIDLATRLSRIMFPMMIFQLLSGVIGGILQADGKFGITTAASSIQNIAVIVCTLVFGSRYGIEAVAVGTMVGAGLAVAVTLPALRSAGFAVRTVIKWGDPGLRRMAILMVPAVLSAGANQVNTLVNRVLASGLPAGSISALNYANKLMYLAPSIIGTSVVTVVYPTLARVAARRNWQAFGDGVTRAIGLVHFVLVPIAMGVLILREPIVRLAFERGAFDSVATRETAWALLFLSLGIAIRPMRDLVSRAFFTLQDTATPFILGLVSVGSNVVLNLVLVGPMAHGGLALGATMSALISLVLGIVYLRRRVAVPLPVRTLMTSVGKSILASVAMSLVIWKVYSCLVTSMPGTQFVHEFIRLATAGGVGVIIYLGLAWFLRVDELRQAREVLRTVLKRVGRQ